MRSRIQVFIAGTSGARRVWLFTLVLTARPSCCPSARAARAARSRAVTIPVVGACRRPSPCRGQGHPSPHRAERALVFDERGPAGCRLLPRLTAGVHRRAARRSGSRSSSIVASARSSSCSTSPSSASALSSPSRRSSHRCRPDARFGLALGPRSFSSRSSRTSSACLASAPRSRWLKAPPSTGASRDAEDRDPRLPDQRESRPDVPRRSVGSRPRWLSSCPRRRRPWPIVRTSRNGSSTRASSCSTSRPASSSAAR